jgi:desulfoferrodoxin (superoxide reductase-like protein)
MDDLYYINFQSNDGFCEIHIRYSIIDHLSIMDHLKKWFILEFANDLYRRRSQEC